ncbi:MAG: molybdate ABC transporter substrate-binding protein [Sandaracinaceae bacterium]|nr:molybdate ABC transporter substrate-binding protein [Myxococcales bacterium]MCB9656461.1 molybdate ABC transporter substrate-binding protein [Sandaracinaceae bacterium]
MRTHSRLRHIAELGWGAHLTLLALLALGAPGCGGEARDDPGVSAARHELVVFAAASLREAFGELGARFERQHPGTHVVLHFAGTQALRAQLELGAHADVLASADERHMEALRRAGLVDAPQVFAHNELVLVVSREAQAWLHSLADLPRAERVVLGTEQVPAGRYASALLERADSALGPGYREQVLAHVVSRELDVRQVLHKVVLGEADAAFVYGTDARSAGARVAVVRVPPELAVTATYPIARVSNGAAPDLASAFVALVLSEQGQASLTEAGFVAAATAPNAEGTP